MIKLVINTYYHMKCSLEDVFAYMPEDVAIKLTRPENNGIWEELLGAARNSVPEQDKDAVVKALKTLPRDRIKEYITIDKDGVKCEGFLSEEEDYAQTTLRYTTPFLFDVDKFWAKWGGTVCQA